MSGQGPLRVTKALFPSIATDIFCLLSYSSFSHRHILVLHNYAMKYLQTVTMKTIDMERVAKELIDVFSRVDIKGDFIGPRSKLHLTASGRY